jgi:MYXO-CTERM domain-containing protein
MQRVGAGDAVPPVLSFISPADGATVPQTFDVHASGTDNIAVASATMTIDATAPVVQMGAGPFTFTTPTLTDGQHTIKIEITDGKNVKAETHTVLVEAGAPPPGTGGNAPGDDGTVVGTCSAGSGGSTALFGLGLLLALRIRRRGA